MKLYDVERFVRHCFSCEAKADRLSIIDSDSWSEKYKCNDCGAIHNAIFQDRMSGCNIDAVVEVEDE